MHRPGLERGGTSEVLDRHGSVRFAIPNRSAYNALWVAQRMDKLDARFGELAVQRGWVTFDKLKEAINIQNKLIELGLEPKPLPDILREKKYLSAEQVELLLAELSGTQRPAATPPPPPAPQPPVVTARNEYEFGEIAIKRGYITFEKLRECLDIQHKLRSLGCEPKRIDEILLEKGYITREQAQAILSEPRTARAPLPRAEAKLGEIAIRKRYITEAQLKEALEIQAAQGNRQKLGEILLEKGFITREQLDHLLLLAARASAPIEIAGYEIIGKIGTGGMGAVYKARQISIDRIVAIKILFPKYTKDRDYVIRFMREARALAQLSHPNIVAAIDAGEIRGVPYYVMEYIDGVPVSTLLEKEGRLPEKQCLEIGIQVARALSHAHKHKIIHRDIKPQNIMLTRDGVAKVCDFGIAKKMDSPEELGLTSEGIAIGTPYYISPEAALGHDVDTRADIYSLGATLYHMAAGSPPFDAESPAQVLSMHVNNPLEPPRRRCPQVSEGLNHLIVRMMRKNPDERYQSPSQVVTDMEKLLRGQPIDPVRDKHKTTTGRMSPVRHKTTARVPAASSAGTILLMGLLIIACALAVVWVLISGDTAGAGRPAPPNSGTDAPAEPPPPRIAAARPREQIEAEHKQRRATYEKLRDRPWDAGHADLLTAPYALIEQSIAFFADTEFGPDWIRLRQEFERWADNRISPLWDRLKAEIQMEAQKGRYRAALERAEQFPRELRYFKPDKPTAAETDRLALVDEILRQRNRAIEEAGRAIAACLRAGDFDQAWSLTDRIEDYGDGAGALLKRRELLEQQVKALTAAPFTPERLKEARARLAALSARYASHDAFAAALQHEALRIEEQYRTTLQQAQAKLQNRAAEAGLDRLLKAREYWNAYDTVVGILTDPELQPALAENGFDPTKLERSPSRLEEAIATTRDPTVTDLLLHARAALLLLELVHSAAKGLDRIAGDRKELSKLNFEGLREATGLRPILADRILAYETDRDRVYLAPKKSPALDESDLLTLAKLGGAESDPAFGLRAGLMFLYAGYPLQAQEFLKKVANDPRLGRWLDRYAVLTAGFPEPPPPKKAPEKKPDPTPADLFKGKAARKGGSVWEIAYDFSDAAQLEDFAIRCADVKTANREAILTDAEGRLAWKAPVGNEVAFEAHFVATGGFDLYLHGTSDADVQFTSGYRFSFGDRASGDQAYLAKWRDNDYQQLGPLKSFRLIPDLEYKVTVVRQANRIGCRLTSLKHAVWIEWEDKDFRAGRIGLRFHDSTSFRLKSFKVTAALDEAWVASELDKLKSQK